MTKHILICTRHLKVKYYTVIIDTARFSTQYKWIPFIIQMFIQAPNQIVSQFHAPNFDFFKYHQQIPFSLQPTIIFFTLPFQVSHALLKIPFIINCYFCDRLLLIALIVRV